MKNSYRVEIYDHDRNEVVWSKEFTTWLEAHEYFVLQAPLIRVNMGMSILEI